MLKVCFVNYIFELKQILGDLGEGLPFRAGTFDGAISISALQVNIIKLSIFIIRLLFVFQ
jgi:hypothetical protein